MALLVEMTQIIEDLIVPENFSMVENGVYRSSFPRSKNIPFLKQLNLKSVVPLIPEEYPKPLMDFYNSPPNNIVLHQHGFDGNKWPFKQIDKEDIMKTLISILDPANRPLLVHCNKGKHRTGSIIGCLRKLRGWSLSSIFAEYLSFALPKTRLEDQMCIEEFDVQEFWKYVEQNKPADTALLVSISQVSLVNTLPSMCRSEESPNISDNS